MGYEETMSARARACTCPRTHHGISSLKVHKDGAGKEWGDLGGQVGGRQNQWSATATATSMRESLRI
jgi:hypothetical protein